MAAADPLPPDPSAPRPRLEPSGGGLPGDDELARIREILVGAALRQVNARCTVLADQLDAGLRALREDVDQRLRRLETSVEQRLTQRDRDRQAVDERVRGELADLRAAWRRELEATTERLGRDAASAIDGLRSQTLGRADLAALLAELGQRLGDRGDEASARGEPGER